MTNKKILVRTGNLKEAATEFIDIWHKVEDGQAPARVEKISFQDQQLLFKTLTPKRFEILKHVHEKGDTSIRSLAKDLGRDYSNIYQDVKLLTQLGLMLKNEKNGTYSVLWDVIVTEIPLTLVKKAKNSSPITAHYPRRARG